MTEIWWILNVAWIYLKSVLSVALTRTNNASNLFPLSLLGICYRNIVETFHCVVYRMKETKVFVEIKIINMWKNFAVCIYKYGWSINEALLSKLTRKIVIIRKRRKVFSPVVESFMPDTFTVRKIKSGSN